MNLITEDRVIIDRYNGRPSSWMTLDGGGPTLQWLVLGYVESFDVYLSVRLEWAQANRFIKSPPVDYDEYLSSFSGHWARAVFVIDETVRTDVAWLIGEDARSKSVMIDGLLRLRESLLVLLEVEQNTALVMAAVEGIDHLTGASP